MYLFWALVPFQKWSLFGSLAVTGLQRLWEEVVSCRGSSPAGWCRGLGITPPKTNMEPQQWRFGRWFCFSMEWFLILHVENLSGVLLVLFCNDQDWNHLDNTWWVHVKFVFLGGCFPLESWKFRWILSNCHDVVWHGESWLQQISDVRNYSKSIQQLSGQIIEQPHPKRLQKVAKEGFKMPLFHTNLTWWNILIWPDFIVVPLFVGFAG